METNTNAPASSMPDLPGDPECYGERGAPVGLPHQPYSSDQSTITADDVVEWFKLEAHRLNLRSVGVTIYDATGPQPIISWVAFRAGQNNSSFNSLEDAATGLLSDREGALKAIAKAEAELNEAKQVLAAIDCPPTERAEGVPL